MRVTKNHIIQFILIIFLITTFLYADNPFDISLDFAKERTYKVKSFIRSSFEIKNTSAFQDTFEIYIDTPLDFKVLRVIKPITLESNQTKRIMFSMMAPHNALFNKDYNFKIIVLSDRSNIEKEESFKINIAPSAKIKIIPPKEKENVSPGDKIEYTFKIINLGNFKDNIRINVTSEHEDKARISEKVLPLEMGEMKEIRIWVTIPEKISLKTNHILTFKAQSISLDRNYRTKQVIRTYVDQPKKLVTSFFKTLPSDVNIRLSRWNDNTINPYLKYSVGDYIYKDYWFKATMQQSWPDNQNNLWGVYERDWFFTVGKRNSKVSFGNSTVRLSELIGRSITGAGITAELNQKKYSGSFFNLKTDKLTYSSNFVGGKVNHKGIGFSFLETKDGDNKNGILGVFSRKSFGVISVNGEYVSNNTFGNDEKAYTFETRLSKEPIKIDAEYLYAGSLFKGARKGVKTFDMRTEYIYTSFLKFFMNMYNTQNNPENDKNLVTDTNDKSEVGASLSYKGLPELYTSFTLNESLSKKTNIISQIREKYLLVRVFKKFKKVALSVYARKGDRRDYIDPNKVDTLEISPDIYFHFKKLTSWIRHSTIFEENTEEDTKTITEKKYLGFQYSPFKKCFCTLNFVREDSEKRHGNNITFDMEYRPSRNFSFGFEQTLNDQYGEIDRDIMVWLDYTKKIGIPLPIFKVKGNIVGRVFVDMNNNALYDEGEETFKDVRLMFEGKDVLTKKNGKYALPPIKEGEYRLNFDIGSLPFNYYPKEEFPVNVNVLRGEKIDYNIPLVQVCKITGTVFFDVNDNGVKDKKDQPYHLIKVLLVKRGRVVNYAYSDINGEYRLSKVMPGKYQIMLDQSWLPKRAETRAITNKTIEIKQGEDYAVNLGFYIKKRKIRRTFYKKESE